MAPWSWFLVRDLWVVMEVAAILLPVLVAPVLLLLLVGVAVTRSRKAMAVGGSWLVFAAAAVVGPWLPRGTGTPAAETAVRIVVANVLATNHDVEAVVADVLHQDPDVVVAPEANQQVHEALAAEFDHALREPGRNAAAVGIYSDVPVELAPSPRHVVGPDRGRRAIVDDRFVLWALHLPRPWIVTKGETSMRPGYHARTLDRFLDALEEEDLPVVLAGDLNLTDRGRGYRKIVEGRTDAMRGIFGSSTSVKTPFRPLLLRIDHVLVPDDWCADGQRRFDLTGSDHRGVAARVGPCATPGR